MFHSIKVLLKYLVLEKTKYILCYFIAFIDMHTYIKMWASKVVLMVKNPLPMAGDIRDMGLSPGWGRNRAGHGNSSIFA